MAKMATLKRKKMKVVKRNPKCSTRNPATVGPAKFPRKNEAVHIP